MPVGEGKYDALCSIVRGMSNADAAIVIIMNGQYGSGFSVQAHEDIHQDLPAILEKIAKEIRESVP